MIKKSLKAGEIDEKGIRNKCGGSRCQRVELVEQYRKLLTLGSTSFFLLPKYGDIDAHLPIKT